MGRREEMSAAGSESRQQRWQEGKSPDHFVDYVLRPRWRSVPRLPVQNMAEVDRFHREIGRSGREGAEPCENEQTGHVTQCNSAQRYTCQVSRQLLR